MSIDRTGSLLFDTYFGRQLSSMYAGIEYTMKKESAYSCALLLSTYTEVLGGLVTGNLQEHDQMKNNYVKFLEYLGGHYLALHKKYDLYAIIRNKLVHEFSPKPSYLIWVSESPNKEKFGIEIIGGNLNFNLQEYYRDFKNGVEKYRGEIGKEGILILNFVRALKMEWGEVAYKPKTELPKNDDNQELDGVIRDIELTIERIQHEIKDYPEEEKNIIDIRRQMAEHLVNLKIALRNNRKPIVKSTMLWLKQTMPEMYNYLVNVNLIRKFLS